MIYNYSDRVKNLKGNAIREIFALLKDPELISFAGGFPTLQTLPNKEIKEITDCLMNSEKALHILQYGSTEGYTPLRNTVASFVKRYGIENVTEDNVLIVSGGQQTIDLTNKCFVNKGDTVLCEAPTYLAFLHILKTYEGNAVGVKSEEDGISISDLEEKIVKCQPKLLYLVPTFSNPTGKTLSEKKRKAIAELTAKYNVMVLEDDPYSELRFSGERVKSLKSFDKAGNVIFTASFSKTIAPGLRCGYCIADKEVIRKLTIGKQATDVHTSSLSQAIINEYLKKGLFEPHVESIKKVYKEKKDAMAEAIKKYMPCDKIKFTDPEGGLFIWGEFSDNIDTDEIFKDVCLKTKVAYVAGSTFFPGENVKNTFRLNYSNATLQQIDEGIKKLGDYFKNLLGAK